MPCPYEELLPFTLARGPGKRARHALPLRWRGRGLPDAAAVARMPHGRRVRHAGLAIDRQRPGTSKGVVFMTLEDETGFVNLVLWDSVFRANGAIARTASFLGVTGTLQSREGGGAPHRRALLGARPPEPRPSRDFQ